MHLLPTATALLLTLLPLASTVAVQGSKHNLYLSTCTRSVGGPQGGNWGGWCRRFRRNCDGPGAPNPGAVTTANLVAYLPNGPSTAPTDFAIVAAPSSVWDGNKTVEAWGQTFLSTSISAGAASQAKGQLVGTAKVGDEDFVCFKDGVTTFKIDQQGVGGYQPDVNCKVDFWCGSIQV